MENIRNKIMKNLRNKIMKNLRNKIMKNLRKRKTIMALMMAMMITIINTTACSFGASGAEKEGSAAGDNMQSETVEKAHADTAENTTENVTENQGGGAADDTPESENQESENQEAGADREDEIEDLSVEDIPQGDPIIGIVESYADHIIVIRDGDDEDLIYYFSTQNARIVEGDSPIVAGEEVEITYQGVMGDENHPGTAVKVVAASMMYRTEGDDK